MRKIALILLMVNLMTQGYSQNILLSKSHNPQNEPIGYIVDYLRLDSVSFFSIGQFHRSEIKSVHLNKQEPAIIITTKLLIVLNGELLSNSKEKSKLSTINLNDIELITKMDKEKSKKMYGKKGKNGVLDIIIKTL